MQKKSTVILITVIAACLLIALFRFNSGVTGLVTGSLFENSANYLDAGNVEERFKNYLSISRHTAKHDILNNPMLFNGYEVVIAGTYQEETVFGEQVGVLTDFHEYGIILVNKKGHEFTAGKHYEVTGIVRVVEHCAGECELIALVEVKEIHEGIDVSNISDYYKREPINITKKK